MLIILHIVLILFLSFVMYKASELLINEIKILVDGGLLSKFLLASVFVGIATSIPELFVGIAAALEKTPNIAFGNAIGSNIANLGLVFSLAVLVSPYVFRVHKQDFSFKTIILLATSSVFPFLLALDGTLSRFDGIFLIALFVVYSVYIFNKTDHKLKASLFNVLHRIERALLKKSIQSSLLKLLIALIILMASSHFLINSALAVSYILNVRPFLVALFIIAPGTSLPELFVALVSISKKEFDVLYGDIFGSLVTNANLVIGVSSLIYPYHLNLFPEYLFSLFGLFGVFGLFIYFSLTKKMFEKWEAALLFGFYLLFFLAECLF